MFKEIKSRRLALLVAIALGGGGFLSSAQNVSAADVTGNSVTIDNTHPPSNNVAVPEEPNIAVGTAAGFVQSRTDSRAVKGNTLTFSNCDYTEGLYGGMTFGTGNVTDNKVFIKPTGSMTGTVYGGVTDGGGNAENNNVSFEGTRARGDLVGGMTTNNSATGPNQVTRGSVKDNTVVLKAGTVEESIFGGVAGNGTIGDVSKNNVSIEDGVVTQNVYGGTAEGDGNATDNIVTLTGGTVHGNVYGGTAVNGNATRNMVNLGDGTSNAVGTVQGIIYGGRNQSGTKDETTGNTLNVNANATALNIQNFSTINFNLNTHMNVGNPLLTLNDPTNKTKLKSLSQIHVKNATVGQRTLISNANGIELDTATDVGQTEGKTETIIKKHSSGTKIFCRTYQFKESTTADTDGLTTWGGRSLLGNTTTKNEITLTGNHNDVYGGWTAKASSITTEGSAEGHSIGNKITFNGAATDRVKDMFGGLTGVVHGNATDNHAILTGGKVRGTLTGGSVGANGGSATHNIVKITGGEVGGATYGGYTSSAGKAENNEVTLTNGTAQNLYGGFSDYGSAEGNKVKISGGTARNVYGGKTSHGNATKNIVEIKGGTVNQSIYGGEADGSGKAEENTVTLTSGTTGGDIFGGLAFSGDATKNTVNINGGSVGSHNVYGAWTTSGNATHNTVTIKGNGGTVQEIIGGRSQSGNATHNTVTIKGGTLGKVYGGYTEAADGTTENNTVNLGDGTNALAPGTTVAEIYGGNKSAKGNTLNVNTAATVGKIENFSTVAFKNAASKLTLTQAGANFDLDSIKADFAATESEVELVEHANGLTLKDNKRFRSNLSTDGTKETNIEARDNDKKIVRYGYTIKGATTATSTSTEMWGGRSAAGNTTTGNEITVNDNNHKKIYGGYTSGTGTSAADKNDSHTNKVTLAGGIYNTVYGGWTKVGKAVSNTVNVTANAQGTLVGGYSASGEASNNVVSVMNAAFTGDITGGQGAVTNYNVIRLRNASVSGTITGGTATNGVDNTLNVSYGTGTSSSVRDITNIQRLHFDMENAPVSNANPLLKLTNVSGGGDKNLTGMKFAVARSGATKKLEKGNTFTLMENTTAPGKKITVGSDVTAEGRDGVSRNYTFDISTDATGKLIATVTKVGMGEQSKSIVETRAGASAFLNDGADFTAGPGMDAAKKAARAAAQSGNVPYAIWAGMGGGSLRHETGSYVDMKGWNLGVGWARENAVQAGSLTFGPFIEYGRGNYDSYLDDGTHGSGKTSFFGAGVMARIETGSHWVDGSLRIGRTKSDYTGLATYDTTSTYYGVQVGAGKDFHVNETDTVGAYVRYAYSHTAGTSAHLSSGETYDFDAVNSHRLRLGTRYTHGMSARSQFYAGLAWEYEFDGDAHATSQGDSAPSPSLKGGSALLELGYRFAPQGSRMSYYLSLNGWQGKRQGITGGVSVKWAF